MSIGKWVRFNSKAQSRSVPVDYVSVSLFRGILIGNNAEKIQPKRALQCMGQLYIYTYIYILKKSTRATKIKKDGSE